MPPAKRAKSSKIENLPAIQRIMLFLLFLLMLIFAFRKALFNGGQPSFEEPIYTWVICTVLLSLPVFLLAMSNKETYRQRISIIQFIGFAYPASYGISMMFAVSSYYSLYYTIICFTYAVCFVSTSIISTRQSGAKKMVDWMMALGYVLVIFGLMNWFGDASLWGTLNWAEGVGQYSAVYKDAVLNSGINPRLASVFQYPNSYAALLIGLLTSTLVLASSTSSHTRFILCTLLPVPVLVSFILASSRAAFLVIPIIFLLTLLFLRLSKQIMFSVYAIVTCLASLSITSPVYTAGKDLQLLYSASGSFRAWSLLISASIVSSAVCYLIFRFLRVKIVDKLMKVEAIKYSNLFLPAAATLLSIFGALMIFANTGIVQMLPDNIQSRIENINWEQHSVLERETFYRDAVKLWADYPIIGAGGGAWQALYEKYQNNPYTSRQAHNFFLQTLVEIGSIGVLLLCSLLVVVLYHFLRSYWKKPEDTRTPYLCYFIIAASILIHSFLDFNMSFVLLGAIVFLCLGGMLGGNELPPFSFQKKMASSNWVFTYPALYAAASILTVSVSISYLSSYNLYSQARNYALSGGNVQQIFTPLNDAIDQLPHPEYAHFKLQILNQLYSQTHANEYERQAEALLAMIKKREPYYKPLLFAELQLRLLKNQYEEAAALLKSRIDDYPWDITLYSELATVYFQHGLHLVHDEQLVQATSLWDEAFSVLGRVNAKAQELENLPEAQQQGRPFGLTPDLALPLGQIEFYRGNYKEAAALLSMRLEIDFNEQKDVDAAIYYLVSLRKTGSDDPGIADSLASAFADDFKAIEDQITALEQSVPLTTQ